ncbi:hypothetical protein MOUN0_A00232 [Monosporozyma unispora]|nr:hypothetical protein C6P44_002974 [Kazachstania unispora]
MTSVQSYINILPSQKKRRISVNSYIPSCSDSEEDIEPGRMTLKRKRKCNRTNQLNYNIRSLSHNQYICYIKKPISIGTVEQMITQEYLKLQDSLYTPTYHVEYDSLTGNEIYVEDTNPNDIQGKIWENLNFNKLYSELAKVQYKDGNFTPRDNVLTINNQYEIPFNDFIKDCNVLQYRLEGGSHNNAMTSAVVEIYIETGDNLNTNNYYPPVLEEVTDAMFS